MSLNTYSVAVTRNLRECYQCEQVFSDSGGRRDLGTAWAADDLPGGNTTFTVNAGVTTTPTYQWQVSTNGGVSYTTVSNGGIYSGATTATLTLTAAPLANNGFLYRQ